MAASHATIFAMPKTDYLRSEHHEFLEASRDALANDNLQKILVRLGDLLGQKNRDAWAALPNSSDVRERRGRSKTPHSPNSIRT